MNKRNILTMVVMIALMILPQVSFSNGKGAMTLLQGKEGQQLIQKVISSNPQAKVFFAEVLGVKPEKLFVDPAATRAMLAERLNGNSADQLALQARASSFLSSHVSADISFTSPRASVLAGKKTLPMPQTATSSDAVLSSHVNKMVINGDISSSMGRAFETAVTTTEIEGRDVVRCITKWQKASNRSLYVETIIEGAKFLPQSPVLAKQAIDATMSKRLGISQVEASKRSCALAGANSAIKCNAYGQPILLQCL